MLNLIRHDLGYSTTEKRFPAKNTCLAIYSRVVNAQSRLDDVLGSHFPWCADWEAELRALFAAYVEAKQRQHVLDYDDLLLYWAQMMAEPAIAADVCERFDHVLVDEYQDTNRLQAAILLALKPNGKGLTVVGDDAQSIYSFRAATVRNILDFPGQFSPRAETITLEHNYRSTQPILAAANAVIDLAAERFTKKLPIRPCLAERPLLVTVQDEADQARYAVEKVLQDRECGLALKTQAVLFRASHHSGPAGSGIDPAQHSIREVRRPEISRSRAHQGRARRSCAFVKIRATASPGSASLQLLPGVGPATAARALDCVAGRGDPAPELPSPSRRPPPPERIGRTLSRRSASCAAPAIGWPAELDLVCRWYEPHLQRIHDDAAVRQADLAQLAQIAQLTRAASASSPNSRWTRRTPPAIGRGAVPRRRLPDPVHHPFRQGPGVDIRHAAQRRRRLHARGSRHRQFAGRSRKSGGCCTSP